MAFDGCFLHKITEELSSFSGGFVDKIHQPSRDELVFVLRTKQGAKRLLISANHQNPRIQITENIPENPATPPMFCMLLRKHIGSGVLQSVTQPSLERVAVLEFSASNEMGDRVTKKLIAEFIGTSPNIILTNENGKIIDALRKSDIENEKARLIQPGAAYILPNSDKLSVLESSNETVVKYLKKQSGKTLQNALVSVLLGVSPKTARALCSVSSLNPDSEIENIQDCQAEKIIGNLRRVLSDKSAPHIAEKDFCFFGAQGFSAFEGDLSQLLDFFYAEKDKAARLLTKSRDLIKLTANLIKRSEKKLNLRYSEAEKCRDRETLRLYGELIKANLHSIKAGSAFAEVCNYYDENLATIKIPLDVALSPAANAAKYFKDYKKACTAEQMIEGLINENKTELEYLESVYESLVLADSIAILDSVREELVGSGYLKQSKTAPRKNTKPASIETRLSPSGFKVYIGRNNIQNDYLTTKLAVKTDIWFHTKNIPGSHVVIETKGQDVPDRDLLFAATLAAKYSRAANSSKVPVDYTEIKNVKKPSGAKPGMVIYKTNSTILANPNEKL